MRLFYIIVSQLEATMNSARLNFLMGFLKRYTIEMMLIWVTTVIHSMTMKHNHHQPTVLQRKTHSWRNETDT